MRKDLLRTGSVTSLVVAVLGLLTGSVKLVAPGVECDLECRRELRRTAELLDQLDGWRWVARWLFILLRGLLAIVAFVVISIVGGVLEVTPLFVRRQRLLADEAAEVAALQRVAVGRRQLALC